MYTKLTRQFYKLRICGKKTSLQQFPLAIFKSDACHFSSCSCRIVWCGVAVACEGEGGVRCWPVFLSACQSARARMNPPLLMALSVRDSCSFRTSLHTTTDIVTIIARPPPPPPPPTRQTCAK